MALNIDPASIAEALRKNVERFSPSVERGEVGRVVETGDGIARVQGLPHAMANELLEFPGGTLGLGVGVTGLPSPTTDVPPDCATSRKRSCAVRLTVSTRSLRFLPGISTMMFLLPWVETSASATPLPLTRWSMIEAASLRLSLLIRDPNVLTTILSLRSWTWRPVYGLVA